MRNSNKTGYLSKRNMLINWQLFNEKKVKLLINQLKIIDLPNGDY